MNVYLQIYIGISGGFAFLNALSYLKTYKELHPVHWITFIDRCKVAVVFGTVFLISWSVSWALFPLLVIDFIVSQIKKLRRIHHGKLGK
jgi:hypothetical protein